MFLYPRAPKTKNPNSNNAVQLPLHAVFPVHRKSKKKSGEKNAEHQN